MSSTPTPEVTTHDHHGQVVRRAIIDRPAAALYAIVADPHMHHLVDGSGTVGEVVTGGRELGVGSTFTVKMKQFGVPYRIKSTVTRAEPGTVIEWRHPLGHTWRWELVSVGEQQTEVTHTFDPRTSLLGAFFRLSGMAKANGTGMSRSLTTLATAATPPVP